MPRKLSILLLVIVLGVLVVAWLRRTGGQDVVAVPQSGAAHADTKPVEVAATPGDATEPVETAPTPETQAADAAQDPSLAHLIVHVVGKADRAPLASVRVSVMQPDQSGQGSSGGEYVGGIHGGLDRSPLSGKEGLVELSLPPEREFRLWAEGEDRQCGRAELIVPALQRAERRNVVIELPTGDDLHFFGRVLSRLNRLPIAGAVAEVVQTDTTSTRGDDGEIVDHSEETVLSHSTSGVDGLFELRLPTWKELDVRIRAAGFGPVLLQTGPQHDTRETAKDIVLSLSATLRARILDANVRPDPKARIRLSSEAYELGVRESAGSYFPSAQEMAWTASADEMGVCLLEGLPPNVSLRIELTYGSGVMQKDLSDLFLSPGEVRELEWRFGGGCRIEGRVVDQQGQKVPGPAIWMLRAENPMPRVFEESDGHQVVKQTSADSEGRFVLSAVSPGTWWIGPAAEETDPHSPSPLAVAPVAQFVEVPGSAGRLDVTLTVHRGLYIRGTVLDPSGDRGSNIHVSGFVEATTLDFTCTTSADGGFVLGPLLPGRYRLCAGGWPDHANSEPVEVEGGSEGLVLKLRAAGSISGTVLDSGNGHGVELEIRYGLRGGSESEPGQGFELLRTKRTFSLKGLVAGKYDVVITGDGDRIGILRAIVVRAGVDTSGQDVSLVPGARLRVTFAGLEKYLTFKASTGGVEISDDGLQAGETTVVLVPPGRVSIEAHWSPERSETKEIDIAVGEEKEVVFGGK